MHASPGPVAIQQKLLDDIEEDVEAASSGLRMETQRADNVRKSSGNCKLYICIVLLLGVLVALLVIGK